MSKGTKKESLLRNNGFQTILGSLLCIVIGLLVGYVVLMIINPKGAGEAILAILKNYFYYPSPVAVVKYLGTTLVKASALLMCSLSVLFAWKVGLFNIGAAGQYVIGVGASLYFALALHMPWYVCLIAAIVCSAIVGGISGALKAYFNVNEVISCIMLNWIGLYSVNMLLSTVKEQQTPYTKTLESTNSSALLPNMGLDKVFSKNEFVTIGIILAVVMAIIVWVVLEKTKFGYELKATGYNKDASNYAGMNGKKNIVLTMMIAGALAGIGGAFAILAPSTIAGSSVTYEPINVIAANGFNGIAVALLGNSSPLGIIFSAMFVSFIQRGGTAASLYEYKPEIIDIVIAVIIYFSSFAMLMSQTVGKFFKRHRKEQTNANAEPQPETKKCEKEGN